MTALVQFSEDDGYLTVLFNALRPEFRHEIVRIYPHSPVFGRGRCEVAGSERSGCTRRLCVAHNRDGTRVERATSTSSGPRPARSRTFPDRR